MAAAGASPSTSTESSIAPGRRPVTSRTTPVRSLIIGAHHRRYHRPDAPAGAPPEPGRPPAERHPATHVRGHPGEDPRLPAGRPGLPQAVVGRRREPPDGHGRPRSGPWHRRLRTAPGRGGGRTGPPPPDPV